MGVGVGDLEGGGGGDHTGLTSEVSLYKNIPGREFHGTVMNAGTPGSVCVCVCTH